MRLSRIFQTALATVVFSVLATSNAFAAAAKSPFKNIDQIARSLQLASYAAASSQRTIKVAILDNGFRDRDKEIGVTLPASTLYHAGPIPVDPAGEEAHGLFMAQLVSGLLAKTPKISYELHLYSAFGYTNLQSAVQSVISDKFDVVLYSQVWEYGGNGDGRGFINALVNQATSAGIVWINAAGNFGDATYQTPVKTLKDDWAFLPSANHGVRLRCFQNPQKKCSLRAVLSWNDFKDDSSLGTDKDLDLVLSDDTMKVLRAGGLQQVKVIPAGGSGFSLYPREIVEADLTPGVYELRVKVRSQNFTGADVLRIVTSGDYLEQLDITSPNETLLAPADNPSVITVGASDSAKSSRSIGMGKPEFSTASAVTLQNGDTFKGSSNSAAMTAALAVIAKSLRPTADRAGVLTFLRNQPTSNDDPPSPDDGPLTLADLQFAPTGPGCFRAANLPVMSAPVSQLMHQGAVAVETTSGFKLMTAKDPFDLRLGPARVRRDDMMVAGPQGFRVEPRSAQRTLPRGSYEVVQLPAGMNYCQF